MRGFFFTLLLLCVVDVGVGFWLGWFTVITDQEDELITATLEIHTGKIRNAFHTAEDKAKHITEGSKSANEERAAGIVSRIEKDASNFTLATTTGKEIVIRLDTSSKITTSQVQGLQIGDRVTVDYQKQEGQNLAQTVTVEPGQ